MKCRIQWESRGGRNLHSARQQKQKKLLCTKSTHMFTSQHHKQRGGVSRCRRSHDDAIITSQLHQQPCYHGFNVLDRQSFQFLHPSVVYPAGSVPPGHSGSPGPRRLVERRVSITFSSQSPTCDRVELISDTFVDV